jgi:hypothetical protein
VTGPRDGRRAIRQNVRQASAGRSNGLA